MIDPAMLYVRLETHLDNVTAKMKAMLETKIPIPQDEIDRDIAIGIDLHQQYIDLLDEVREKFQEASTCGDGNFRQFCEFFNGWFCGLSPQEQEQFTRKGETA